MEKFNLVIQTAFVGDLILTIPLLRIIKKTDPKTPLVVVCRKGCGDFLLQEKIVDEVLEVNKNKNDSWPRAFELLRQRDYKYIISPHRSFRTAYYVWQLSAEKKIGYKSWWNFFIFDIRVNRPMEKPEVLRQLELIRHLSPDVDQELQQISTNSWNVPEKSPDIPKLFLLNSLTRFEAKEKTIFLSPGSEWPTKRWERDGFAQVGQRFSNLGYRVIVTGVESESDVCSYVANKIPESVNLCGKTNIDDLYKLYIKGSALITNDNGSAHIGAYAGIPVVAVFGPTVLEFGYRPWTDKVGIAQVDLNCRPCSIHGSKVCPIGTHDCMKKVSSDIVFAKAMELINKNANN